jgi:hypothetical protein
MKKILVATLLFFNFSLFSQFESSGFLISTGLSFSKKETFTPLNPAFMNVPNLPPNQANQTALNISPEISYVVNSKFMIGLGYTSVQSKRESNTTSGFSSTNGIITSVRKTVSISENKQSGLSLHIRYSQNIMSNLVVNLKFNYINWKGTASVENTSTNTPVGNPIPPFLANSTFNFGEVRFSPSLHYFISKGFGCYVETLGLNFQFDDSRAKPNSTNYNFDLNPENWRIGFFYFIPTQKAIE